MCVRWQRLSTSIYKNTWTKQTTISAVSSIRLVRDGSVRGSVWQEDVRDSIGNKLNFLLSFQVHQNNVFLVDALGRNR